MKYNPDSIGLIPDGEKCFIEVLEAVDHTAKNGNESIKLTVGVWEDVSMRAKIPVYLTQIYAFLFKHGCTALLGEAKFKSGEIFASDFIGKSCDAIIGIERGEYDGKKTEKNIVIDFLPRTAPAPERNAPPASDEEMPF